MHHTEYGSTERETEADKPIPVTGSREFRYMAKSYNRMHEKLYGNKEDTP